MRHRVFQQLWRDGLLQDGITGQPHPFILEPFLGVTGEVNHFYGRVTLPHTLGEFIAHHQGHHQIGQQEIKGTGCFQSLRAARSLSSLVTDEVEHQRRKHAERRFVVNDENAGHDSTLFKQRRPELSSFARLTTPPDQANLVTPGRRMYFRNLDTGEWSEISN
jgi:hypothetical protein